MSMPCSPWRKHKVPVVEDACQAHFAEWRGRRVSSLGDAGCFSFQASKNLNSGEGGAVLTSSDELAERCYAIHTNGRSRKGGSWWGASARMANFRMTEFQAALLMTQMTRLEEQARIRERNAQYLTRLVSEIPGITPAGIYEGCTRHAYHLYMFRYDAEKFAGLDRGPFLRALAAEGVPMYAGYGPLNQDPFIRGTLESRGFQAVLTKQRLAEWHQRNKCPENDRLCAEAVWFNQPQLLGPKRDMEQIAEAIAKIQAHAGDLARA